jgi:hypothetical protein
MGPAQFPMVTRRAMGLLAFMSSAVLAAGCGGSTAGTTANVTAVTQAAYVTTLSPGYKFDMTLSTSSGTHNFTFTGTGALDEHDGRGQMSLHVKGKTLTELIDNPYIYLHAPSAASTASSGAKPWVRADLDTYTQALGASSPFGGSATGPTEMLKFLKAAGQVIVVGQESVRGVPTTHYHATVDFSRYSSAVAPALRAGAKREAALLERVTGSTSLPMDVWVDSHSRVRRLSLAMKICTAEGKLTESMTMSMYDYSRQTLELPPPASQATDITKELKAQATQGLQQLGC